MPVPELAARKKDLRQAPCVNVVCESCGYAAGVIDRDGWLTTWSRALTMEPAMPLDERKALFGGHIPDLHAVAGGPLDAVDEPLVLWCPTHEDIDFDPDAARAAFDRVRPKHRRARLACPVRDHGGGADGEGHA